MKKILYIIPYVPYPLISGGNQAFFHMIEYLRYKVNISILLNPINEKQESDVEELKKLWNNVDFYVFTESMKDAKVRNPLYYKWLKKARLSIKRKMRRQLLVDDKKDIARNRSTLFISNFKPLHKKYIRFISSVVKQGFDLIQVEFYELISLGYLFPEDAQTVFVHHELRYVRNENEMILFNQVNDEERMLFRIARNFERSALQSFKHIIALTETDRQLLVDFLGREERIYASPAVVQLAVNSEVKYIPGARRLTFVGSEDHYPNLDAVIWFCKEIAPCLRKKGFNFTFQVIGKWHTIYAKELSNSCPELELVGYIEDLHSFLLGSICVVPVRIGSGMRMKILDAVLSKIPIVTTTKGIEGIDFRDGEECLKTDRADDFADTIIDLAANVDLQEKLVNQADYRLRQLYNPQKMLDRRLAIYNQILLADKE